VQGGRTVVVVEEFDPAPHQLPFYDADALADDVRWAVHVGFALAMWLRVRHVDHNGRLTNESTLQVAIATHALAAEVARLPAAGAFTQLTRAVGSFGRVHGLTLQVAPVAGSPDLRVLEAEASLPDGARAPGGAVKLGTTAQLASYLRRYQTPYRLLRQLAERPGQLPRRSEPPRAPPGIGPGRARPAGGGGMTDVATEDLSRYSACVLLGAAGLGKTFELERLAQIEASDGRQVVRARLAALAQSAEGLEQHPQGMLGTASANTAMVQLTQIKDAVFSRVSSKLQLLILV